MSSLQQIFLAPFDLFHNTDGMGNRLLLISGTGFLGSFLKNALNEIDPELRFSARKNDGNQRNCIPLNLELPVYPQLLPELEKISPTHLIFCAAMSDPNQCYEQPELSNRVNVIAVKEILELCKSFSIKPIFFSSDLVFGGKKDLCKEEESTSPGTLYGRQKVDIEEHLTIHHPQSIIFRVSKLLSIDPHPRNILNPIFSALFHQKEARLFTDQYTTPLFIEDIHVALRYAIQLNLNGIFHLGMMEKFSRYEMGLHLAELLGRDSKYLLPILMKEFSFPEDRGTTNTLCSKKFEVRTDFRFRSFRDFLPELKKNSLLF